MLKMRQWFEENDQYTLTEPLPENILNTPTLSLTRLHKDVDDMGQEVIKTQKGWGQESFMEGFKSGDFKPKYKLRRYEEQGVPFGIIMRSLPLLCVDLDGKNGGIAASRILRLPETQAELSKSGKGYHLFYSIPDAEWDEQYGFSDYGDFNSLLPGIDIRSTGIVYHYNTQRWNGLLPTPLPNTLRVLMERKIDERARSKARRIVALSASDEDRAIAQHEAIENLKQKIPAGRRNTTLFAMGCRLLETGVSDWETLLSVKAEASGLSAREAQDIIRNVSRYA